MPTRFEAVEENEDVRALREKREELRARIEKAQAQTEAARAAHTAALEEAERLEAKAELGEASLKDLKAARSERARTLEGLEKAENGANLTAKRRAVRELDERLNETRERVREELFGSIAEEAEDAAGEVLEACRLLSKAGEKNAALIERLRSLGVNGTSVKKVSPVLYVSQYVTLERIKPDNLRDFFEAAEEAGMEEDMPPAALEMA